jgi:3-hydroxyacyl-CoA dehydrogenase
MGHGVAQTVAQAGYEVVAVESSNQILDTGMKRINDSLQKIIAKDVAKGKYASEAQGKEAFAKVMSKIKPSVNLSDLQSCDLIVEAIAENMSLKVKFYESLADSMASSPETIFASNTSSLPITGMALASRRPDKFVGLHFFNPVQIMKLVEVIRTEHTHDDIFEAMVAFSTK